MKRGWMSLILACGLFLCAGSRAEAQGLRSKLNPEWLPSYKLGVIAGLNASNFSHSGYDAKCGFHVGVEAMFDMSAFVDNTFIRTGLLFNRKGAKVDGVAGVGDIKFRPCYIEIPARYGYGYVFSPDVVLYGEIGPYLALGVGGKVRWETKDLAGKEISHSESFFGDAKRFDFGLGFHAGVILYKLHQLSLGYDFGYINMTDDTAQNRNFMCSYTYYFR